MECYQTVYSNISFISMIEENQKISVRKNYVQTNTIITSIIRTFLYQEDRNSTYKYISENVDQAFKLLSELENNMVPQTSTEINYINLLNILRKSVEGINKLKITYKSDSYFCARLDALTATMQSRFADLGA